MKLKNTILLFLLSSIILINCNNEVPALLDPDGLPQNSKTGNTLTSVVYTSDGTKLDLFIYNGDFISSNEFFGKELQLVLDYSGNPLTASYKQSSSYMELDNIGENNEYMKITSWIDGSQNGWTMWGAVIKSPGNNNFGFREYIDLSDYSQLIFDIKTDPSHPVPDGCLKVSVKDSTDPDDGTETKLAVNGITTEWQTKKYDLSSITTLSKTNAFLMFEFVIEAGTPTGEYIYYIDNVGFKK